MSLTGSLSSALSGLTAAARGAEVVASNIANAQTAGYGRRELSVAARTLGSSGSGVSVVGITRVVDRALLNDRRIADAGASLGATRAEFLSRLESRLGQPGQDGALGTRIGLLESALLGAAARPESGPQLSAVLSAAQGLATHLGQASAAVQSDRAAADRAIGLDVA
ncbi:MAG: flagellar basal body protein, partial [Gemmobacter sp.]|nr:flagellar basal body protein [Gemmobacter sp.]